jgi:hypothetical protein
MLNVGGVLACTLRYPTWSCNTGRMFSVIPGSVCPWMLTGKEEAMNRLSVKVFVMEGWIWNPAKCLNCLVVLLGALCGGAMLGIVCNRTASNMPPCSGSAFLVRILTHRRLQAFYSR